MWDNQICIRKTKDAFQKVCKGSTVTLETKKRLLNFHAMSTLICGSEISSQEEKTSGDRDVVISTNFENTMDRAYNEFRISI